MFKQIGSDPKASVSDAFSSIAVENVEIVFQRPASQYRPECRDGSFVELMQQAPHKFISHRR